MFKILTYLFGISIVLTGCSLNKNSLFEVGDKEITHYHSVSNDEFVYHLESLASDYLENQADISVKISRESTDYLNSLYTSLVANSELILSKSIKPKFYIIKDQTPFYFSLPGGHIFMSLGLIKRYLKHEEYLVSVIAMEIVRSHRNIYNKKAVVPTGHVNTELLASITKINSDLKAKVNEWAHYVMTRAGHDGHVLLIWLQTLNRNNLEFNLLYSDAQAITKEESLFKSFIVTSGMTTWTESKGELNSSKGFYKFIEEIRRVNI